MKDYYTKQLERLHGRAKVKFVSDDGETKWMDINRDSCRAIGKTLTSLDNSKQITVE